VGVAVSLVCDDNVTMCGVWLEVGTPGRLLAEPPGGPPEALGGAVLTVGNDVLEVERQLSAGLLRSVRDTAEICRQVHTCWSAICWK